jgi:hypothetical protein
VSALNDGRSRNFSAKRRSVKSVPNDTTPHALLMSMNRLLLFRGSKQMPWEIGLGDGFGPKW